MYLFTTDAKTASRYWRILVCGLVLAGLLVGLPLTTARAEPQKKHEGKGHAAKKVGHHVKSKKQKGLHARSKRHGPKRHHARVHVAKKHRLAHCGRCHKPHVVKVGAKVVRPRRVLVP